MISPQGLAIEIARCPELAMARADEGHPCSKVVRLQHETDWQVPEAWAGAIDTARIVFLSSNPSISEDSGDGGGEAYPLSSWTDDQVADFMLRRFDPSAGFTDAADHFRQRNGHMSSQRVRFWMLVRKRAAELLGEADPSRDYVMTEVVHCKSRAEVGVQEATEICGDRYLERVLAVSPAEVVVIVGAKARDRVSGLLRLPVGFGRKHTVGIDEAANLAVRPIGGRRRLLAYLWHPTGMTGPKDFARAYPRRLEALRRVAQGRDTPESALD